MSMQDIAIIYKITKKRQKSFMKKNKEIFLKRRKKSKKHMEKIVT